MFLSISKTLAQQIVDTIHDVCQYHINFITTDGMIYASSDPSRIGTFHEIGKQVASTGKTIEVDSDNTYPGTHKGINIPIYYHSEMVAIVGISGDVHEVTRFAHLAERISHILLHEKELVAIHRSLDEKKLYVIQSLQSQGLDKNLYFLDCLHTFHLNPSDIFRVVTIEVNTRYNLVNISLLEQDIQRFLTSLNESVFAYIYPNKFIALIRNQTFQSHFEKFTQFANENQNIIQLALGMARPLENIKEAWDSSTIALDAIRNTKQTYALFDELSLEILLTGISSTHRVEFAKKLLKCLNKDDIQFLHTYYDEDMSLQNTASRLYLHKNTVQQRLNRIQDKTGLNPRKFKEANLFYLAIELNRINTSTNKETKEKS
jgi:sugar diacid utilization regulator